MAKKVITEVNKIEFPSKTTYWVAMDGDTYITHGFTTPRQVTESVYTLVEYSTESEWKKAIESYSPEEEVLEDLDTTNIK